MAGPGTKLPIKNVRAMVATEGKADHLVLRQMDSSAYSLRRWVPSDTLLDFASRNDLQGGAVAAFTS